MNGELTYNSLVNKVANVINLDVIDASTISCFHYLVTVYFPFFPGNELDRQR